MQKVIHEESGEVGEMQKKAIFIKLKAQYFLLGITLGMCYNIIRRSDCFLSHRC